MSRSLTFGLAEIYRRTLYEEVSRRLKVSQAAPSETRVPLCTTSLLTEIHVKIESRSQLVATCIGEDTHPIPGVFTT